jgi:regulator of nucleoside diphosphate kinase
MTTPLPVSTTTLVYVASDQLAQLQDLADRVARPGADLLRRELERAIVLAEDDCPSTFVRLNSVVEYTDLQSGRTRKLALVLPHEADVDAHRVSVASPVGIALLGLTPGQSVNWTAADGRAHALVVHSVESRS